MSRSMTELCVCEYKGGQFFWPAAWAVFVWFVHVGLGESAALVHFGEQSLAEDTVWEDPWLSFLTFPLLGRGVVGCLAGCSCLCSGVGVLRFLGLWVYIRRLLLIVGRFLRLDECK